MDGDPIADSSRLVEEARKTQADFLKVDLETAMTFVAMARTAEHPENRDRSQRNARRAYDTVMGFMASATVTKPELDEINSRLKRLREELKELGEVL